MEEWRDIPGYEGIYQASTEGRIRSVPGKITSSRRFKVRVWKTRILKPKLHRDFRVSLWKDGEVKTCLVSRLVAMTWVSGYKQGLTVNHIDGNPQNNKRENLEWLTLADNIRVGYECGLYQSTQRKVTLFSNGESITFSSMSAASRALGKNNRYVSCAFKRGSKVRDNCGVEYSIICKEGGCHSPHGCAD